MLLSSDNHLWLEDSSDLDSFYEYLSDNINEYLPNFVKRSQTARFDGFTVNCCREEEGQVITFTIRWADISDDAQVRWQSLVQSEGYRMILEGLTFHNVRTPSRKVSASREKSRSEETLHKKTKQESETTIEANKINQVAEDIRTADQPAPTQLLQIRLIVLENIDRNILRSKYVVELPSNLTIDNVLDSIEDEIDDNQKVQVYYSTEPIRGRKDLKPIDMSSRSNDPLSSIANGKGVLYFVVATRGIRVHKNPSDPNTAVTQPSDYLL
ncbi:hypothetical protein Q1695_004033 [Nippostrongylus brasiliensis]|nr:hypothetical protein Q1695_004033 [Nippostrongylus brasiliensis]